MDFTSWKLELVDKAIRQISYKSNMSNSEKTELSLVLSDYLDEGISILRKWRKLKDDSEFVNGDHDSGLIDFIKNKHSANGRELYSDYSSGGVKATMKKTPESVLKSSCKQVI